MKIREWIIHLLGGFTRNDKFLPKPIRTATIMTFWTFGQPKLGQRIDVEMKSGMTAIYEVCRIEQATGVDWCWIDLSFVAYRDEPAKETLHLP